jgi:Ni/Fe-hydrogenase subunit HybB-like protein
MHWPAVGVAGLEHANGTHYAPTWMEVMVSVGLVAVGFAAFVRAMCSFRIFSEPGHAPVVPAAPACPLVAETSGGEP